MCVIIVAYSCIVARLWCDVSVSYGDFRCQFDSLFLLSLAGLDLVTDFVKLTPFLPCLYLISLDGNFLQV